MSKQVNVGKPVNGNTHTLQAGSASGVFWVDLYGQSHAVQVQYTRQGHPGRLKIDNTEINGIDLSKKNPALGFTLAQLRNGVGLTVDQVIRSLSISRGEVYRDFKG